MFGDDYKRDIENIKADKALKRKISESIKTGSVASHKEKKPKSVLFRAAMAVAACVAVVLSVWVTGADRIKINSSSGETGITAKADYTEIYKTLKAFADRQKKENVIEKIDEVFKGGFTKKNYDVNEEVVDYGAEAATGTNGSNAGETYSETTTQVTDVDEADIVKTDGKYIYSLSDYENEKRTLRIIRAGDKPKLISSTELDCNIGQMYLASGRLIFFSRESGGDIASVKATVYDVSSPEKPKRLFSCEQSGNYETTRLIGNVLYMITDYYVPLNGLKRDKPETYAPQVTCEDYDGAVVAESISVNENVKLPEYTVICAFSLEDGSLLGTQSLLGGAYTVYCSTESIIIAGYFADGKTALSKISLNGGKLKLTAEGSIDGDLLNQFSIDEYKGYFRFVTTVYTSEESLDGDIASYKTESTNSLYVLDGNLKTVGSIVGLAPEERVYSVRFMGDTAYFVTFRQVDPLFSVDLSDPKNPQIIGKLKIPGFSNYLYPFGEGKLLGIGQEADSETGRTGGIKLSMFDISNPADVTEKAKTVLEYRYSDALSDHTATLVDRKRGLIGFSTYGNTGSKYLIFTFKNGGFKQLAEIKLGDVYTNVRGLYVGNSFYVVTDSTLYAYDMNTYTETSKIKL